MSRPLIGIDVGWSKKRRSCGVALANTSLTIPGPTSRYGLIESGCLRLDTLLETIRGWRTRNPGALARAIVVIDGPLGPAGRPTLDRYVDKACAIGGFAGRCQPMPVSHPSSAQYLDATYAVLEALGMSHDVWAGGPIPDEGPVVAETNPTVALALLTAQQPIARLPSRRFARALPVNGESRLIRAKSDWYWEIGGDQVVSGHLTRDGLLPEHDHERIAALTCLGIAAALQDKAALAIGDEHGIYAVFPTYDMSWESDVRRVGIRHGTGAPCHRPALAGIDAQVPVVPVAVVESTRDAGRTPLDDLDLDGGDEVDLLLCDSGGVNEKHNPWLAGCLPALGLRTLGDRGQVISLDHGPGRPRNPDQWIASPKTDEIRKLLRPSLANSGHDFERPLSLENSLALRVCLDVG